MEVKNGILYDVVESDIELLNNDPEKFWQGVTAIGKDAFISCQNLTSIKIPNTVTSIGDWAFADCVNLTSISISSTLNSIGKFVLLGCENLKVITIDGKPYSANVDLDKLIASLDENENAEQTDPLNP